MKRHLLVGGFAVVVLVSWGMCHVAAEEGEAKALSSRITEVTVYADRARVTRVATVPLTAEPARVAFQKLPGWIDEGSVRVSLSPAGAGDLLDVQVQKTFLARPDDEGIRKAQEAVQEVADQIAALDDERSVLEAQSRQVDAIRAFSLEKLPKDTAAREVKIDEYDGVVKFLGKSMLDIARAKRELEKKRRVLQPELDARRKKLDELQARAQLEQRSVVIVARGGAAAQTATLTLTYMLPGATWEPMHEVRTGGGRESVTITSFAVVTQTTGEDWDGTALSLSTQRPTETVRIPELEAILLGGHRPVSGIVGSHDTFQSAASNFKGQWLSWNKSTQVDAVQVELNENLNEQEARQARMVKVFETLQQKRGTTAHFQATGRQTVRTDGRAVRLSIGSMQFKAQPQIIAAPEVSLNAAHTATMENTGGQALLPGKVLLFVDDAFLGTTGTDFVAQGESFPLFLGVAERVKLSRSLDTKRSALSWSGRRTRMQVSFLVTAENLSDKEVALRLGDRVPVSQTEEIRVQDVRLTPSVKADAKGLLRWDVTLAPKQKREFRIEYQLDYPVELPSRISAEKEKRDMAEDSGASPEEPVNAPAEDLPGHILKLENALK